MNNIGNNIWCLRNAALMNRSQFAREVGISRITVTRIEQRKDRPSDRTIEKIAAAFKIHRNDLLGNEDSF